METPSSGTPGAEAPQARPRKAAPRVLYLVPDLLGPPSGIARYCCMVCRALLEDGHQVAVVSMLDKSSAWRRARSEFPRSQYLRYWPCSGRRARFVMRAVRLALAARTRPSLVVVGHPNLTPLGWLLARLCRAPMVSFIYGVDAWEPLSSARRRALAASDLILSISRFTARCATAANGLPEGRIHILHNCLDPQMQIQHPSSTCGGDAGADRNLEARSLLTVARITLAEKYKGHEVVIGALPALLERFPDLIYNVVGDGDGRRDLEDLARKLGVSGSVRFHGVVKDEELVRFYREATVFIMPSRREGFGFVFIEAMLQGTPAIGGTVDATPEVIAPGRTGLLVNPGSEAEVVQAVSLLLDDSGLCRRMGQAAQQDVLERFGFGLFSHTLRGYLRQYLHGVERPDC